MKKQLIALLIATAGFYGDTIAAEINSSTLFVNVKVTHGGLASAKPVSPKLTAPPDKLLMPVVFLTVAREAKAAPQQTSIDTRTRASTTSAIQGKPLLFLPDSKSFWERDTTLFQNGTSVRFGPVSEPDIRHGVPAGWGLKLSIPIGRK